MSGDSRLILINKLITAADAFRLGEEGQASEYFRVCIDSIEPFLSRLPAAELSACMSAILSAQERHDWLALADGLEYELVPLLNEII